MVSIMRLITRLGNCERLREHDLPIMSYEYRTCHDDAEWGYKDCMKKIGGLVFLFARDRASSLWVRKRQRSAAHDALVVGRRRFCV